MEIVFNQVGRTWQAEFTVTADFNLHIERPATGFMYLSQRTGDSGEYDTAHTLENGQFVYDYDFTALVYPKSIKIVSEVEPTLARLTIAE